MDFSGCRSTHFEFSEKISYLNGSGRSPQLKSTSIVGAKCTSPPNFFLLFSQLNSDATLKSNPWEVDLTDYSSEVRELYGKLIESPAENIAIVPSTSYAITLASKLIGLECRVGRTEVCVLEVRESFIKQLVFTFSK